MEALSRMAPEDQREVLNERAAIAEFDGGLTREQAERLAVTVQSATTSRSTT